ncbi:hypothetical protein MHYP_G00139200 [Metynnis hypsauchen]
MEAGKPAKEGMNQSLEEKQMKEEITASIPLHDIKKSPLSSTVREVPLGQTRLGVSWQSHWTAGIYLDFKELGPLESNTIPQEVCGYLAFTSDVYAFSTKRHVRQVICYDSNKVVSSNNRH